MQVININKFDLGYKSAILFGLTALFFSFLIGVFSGNQISAVVLRSLIFMVGFSLLGFVSVYIIKNYVPEFYEILLFNQSDSEVENTNISPEDAVEGDKKITDTPYDVPEGEGDSKSQVTNMTDIDDELTSFTESAAKGPGSNKNISGRIPGDVMTRFNEKIKYEPKIMAQAVRTMMKKDAE